MSALPQLTSNPAADAEARDNALQARDDALTLARQAWADNATGEEIEDHASREDWLRMADLVADLANYRISEFQAFERAGDILESVAMSAVRSIKTPAERAKFLLDLQVEQAR